MPTCKIEPRVWLPRETGFSLPSFVVIRNVKGLSKRLFGTVNIDFGQANGERNACVNSHIGGCRSRPNLPVVTD